MSSKHITPSGFRKLEEELDQLWKKERPELLTAVADAAAMGDRSENAEYIYGKKRLRQIDSRVRWLRKRLSEVIVVREHPSNPKKIYFGANIKIKDENGAVLAFQLVGSDDIGGDGKMSMDSALGRALRGREKGDTVPVILPKGTKSFTILNVRYEE